MLDYSYFPPVESLYKVLKHCPDCALVFIKLWDERDEKGHLTIEKTDVRNIFHLSPTILRNSCLELRDEQIIEFEENDKYFVIEFLIK